VAPVFLAPQLFGGKKGCEWIVPLLPPGLEQKRRWGALESDPSFKKDGPRTGRSVPLTPPTWSRRGCRRLFFCGPSVRTHWQPGPETTLLIARVGVPVKKHPLWYSDRGGGGVLSVSGPFVTSGGRPRVPGPKEVPWCRWGRPPNPCRLWQGPIPLPALPLRWAPVWGLGPRAGPPEGGGLRAARKIPAGLESNGSCLWLRQRELRPSAVSPCGSVGILEPSDHKPPHLYPLGPARGAFSPPGRLCARGGIIQSSIDVPRPPAPRETCPPLLTQRAFGPREPPGPPVPGRETVKLPPPNFPRVERAPGGAALFPALSPLSEPPRGVGAASPSSFFSCCLSPAPARILLPPPFSCFSCRRAGARPPPRSG